jgi:YD repeat-containing protein
MALTGGTAYDDIRIFPSDAQMTTYTYDSAGNVTSSMDAKGLTTYYEYDAMQRLMNVKDKDGNIVKHIDYHYHGQ